MFDSSVTCLFPLPLTVFEKYMFWDDLPDHPMVFTCLLRVSGEIVRPAFEAALDEAIGRHPLLCALVGHAARKGLVWTLAEHLRPAIDWGMLGVEFRTPRGEGIDLRSEVGLRVWVRQGEGRAEVALQFHHSCCDGTGALRFISDLLAAYGLRTACADRRPTLCDCDPRVLLRRGEYALCGVPPPGKAPAIWANLLDTARMFGRRPATLGPSVPTSTSAAMAMPFPGICESALDPAESRNLRRAAVRQGVTVNDLMLRDLVETMRDWKLAQSSDSAPGWLRIAIPVRLPGVGDSRLPAANRTTYTFLTRPGVRRVDSRDLLQGIHHETDAFTRSRRGLQFLRALGIVDRVPGAMSLIRRVKRRMATVVFSNLGDIGRRLRSRIRDGSGRIVAGDLIVEEIVSAPPTRPDTHAALLSYIYGGRVCLHARCDPQVFSAEDAQRFLAAYVSRLRGTIQEANLARAA